MKAIFKAFPAQGIEVREVEAPLPGEGEVLLKVKAASICGSDVHIYNWRKGYEFLIPHLPVILGHEFAGEVVEAGPGMTGWNKGDPATAEVARICGECFYCKTGKFTLCEKRNVSRLGIEKNGGMAEYVAVRAASLHRLPPGVSCEEASLTEPCCVALGAVRLAHIFPGDTAAIIGPGPIGLMALQAARAAGARKTLIVGTSIDARRLTLAEDLGADRTVNAEKSDPVKAVKEMTDGIGAGTVFEISGSIAGVNLALDMVRKGGEVILVGIYPGPLELAVTQRIVREMKTLRGSFGTTSILWDTALGLMASGAIKIKPLITHRVSIARGEEGFLAADRKEAVKALIIPP
jgi:L-iditol 2-dehydrogenase